MKLWPLLLVLAACKNPVLPLPPAADLVVAVTSEPHDWSHYSCTVAVALVSPTGRVAADGASVGAGSKATFTLTAPLGRYDAHIALRWAGRPGTTWDLDGTWYDTLSVQVPGNHRIECP